MNTDFKKPALLSLALVIVATTLFFSCKGDKDQRQPPTMSLKTDAGYTAANATVGMNDTLKVGVVVTKTEDALKSFNVSYAYDGATTTTTDTTEQLHGDDQTVGFTRDVQIITRNVAGSEKWTFTVTDLDGNIAQQSITLTVN